MMVSAYGFSGLLGPGSVSDPGRIAAGVVTGIGFLGAGTIIQQRGGVRGLTTAATIWVVSGIGLAVGVGFYAGAVFTTIFVLISLLALRRFEKHFFSRRRMKSLLVRGIDQPGLLGGIGAVLGNLMVNIRKSELSELEKVAEGGHELINIEFLVEIPLDLDLKMLFNRLYCLTGVKEIHWEGDLVNREDCTLEF
jgi:putative Mg2+ transporter-C (MgtC) family protein